VVKQLAREILPHYRRAFHAEFEESGSLVALGLDKRAVHHKEMADALFEQQAPELRWTGYETVREGLSAWADQYKIRTVWIARFALDALLEWTLRGSPLPLQELPSRDQLTEYLADLSSDDRAKFLLEQQRLAQQTVTFPIYPLGLQHYDPSPARVFEYPPWDGHDEQAYEKGVLRLFEGHLKRYVDEISTKTSDYVPVEPITKPERFDMLALYLCRDLSIGQIAPLFNKDPTGIHRDLHSAAELIDIPIPSKRGRPRKKPKSASEH
jgi:hypothetical protein